VLGARMAIKITVPYASPHIDFNDVLGGAIQANCRTENMDLVILLASLCLAGIMAKINKHFSRNNYQIFLFTRKGFNKQQMREPHYY
jgi:hypothetical protein